MSRYQLPLTVAVLGRSYGQVAHGIAEDLAAAVRETWEDALDSLLARHMFAGGVFGLFWVVAFAAALETGAPARVVDALGAIGCGVLGVLAGSAARTQMLGRRAERTNTRPAVLLAERRGLLRLLPGMTGSFASCAWLALPG